MNIAKELFALNWITGIHNSVIHIYDKQERKEHLGFPHSNLDILLFFIVFLWGAFSIFFSISLMSR